MLTIEVNDTAVMARLSSMPDKLPAAFLNKTYALAEKLKSKVQQNPYQPHPENPDGQGLAPHFRAG